MKGTGTIDDCRATSRYITMIFQNTGDKEMIVQASIEEKTSYIEGIRNWNVFEVLSGNIEF